jgi:hypothetical protein
MSELPDTEDIESFWEGLRPPRDPSTFTNVPIVNESGLVGVANQPEDLLEPYLSNYTVDYGDNTAIEVSESNVAFTTIREVSESHLTDPVTDPPYSLRVSGYDRSNLGLFREIVYTTERLRRLLNTAGVTYNFTRLIDVIDTRAQDLDIGPEDPRLSYFQEIRALLFNFEDTDARR